MSADQTTLILSFENQHYNPINVYWIDDFEQNPLLKNKLQAQLDPRESYMQGTFSGQEWMVLDQVNGKLLLRMKARKDEEIFIRGQERRMPVKGSTLDLISAAFRPTEPDLNFALDFDGENDVVVIPHQNDLHLGTNGDAYQWTLEAWVYRYLDRQEHPILEKSDSVNGGYALRIGENGKFQAGLLEGSRFIYGESEAVLQPRQWYHLAATFNGKTLLKFTNHYELIWQSSNDRYLQQATFFRPLPPPGYGRLGDYCEPGLLPLDLRQADGKYQLPRRLLVVCLSNDVNAPGVPVTKEDGTPLTDQNGNEFSAWTDGFRAADGFTEVWRNNDANGPLSIWRPTLSTDDNNDYEALGYAVVASFTAPDPATSPYYLVHHALLNNNVQLEDRADWTNTLLQLDAGETSLEIKGIMGTGLFTALDPSSTPVTPPVYFAFQAQLVEQSYSQFQLYINGAAETTTLRHGLDLQSQRTVLDLNGEGEYLALPNIPATPSTTGDHLFTGGLTFESWVNFRHDEGTVIQAGDISHPIFHLRETPAAVAAAATATATLDRVQSDRAEALTAVTEFLTAEAATVDTIQADGNGAQTAASTINPTLLTEEEEVTLEDGTTLAPTPKLTILNDLPNAVSSLKTATEDIATAFTANVTLQSEVAAILATLQAAPPFAQAAQPAVAAIQFFFAKLQRAVTIVVDATASELSAATTSQAEKQTAANAEGFSDQEQDAADALLVLADDRLELATALDAEAKKIVIDDPLKNLFTAIIATLPSAELVQNTEATQTALADLPTPDPGDAPTTAPGVTELLAVGQVMADLATSLDLLSHLLAIDDALPTLTSSIDNLNTALSHQDNAVEQANSAAQAAEQALNTALETRKGLRLAYDVANNQLTLATENGISINAVTLPGFLTIETRTSPLLTVLQRELENVRSDANDLALLDPELKPLADRLVAIQITAAGLSLAIPEDGDSTALPASINTILEDLLTNTQATGARLSTTGTGFTVPAGDLSVGPLQTAISDLNNQLALLTATSPQAEYGSALAQAKTTVSAAQSAPATGANQELSKLAIRLAQLVQRSLAAARTTATYREILTADNTAVNTETEVFRTNKELNKWLHLAISIAANGEVVVYKNGQISASNATAFTQADIANQFNDIFGGKNQNHLGHIIDSENSFFNGHLSEVRLWSTVRDADDIAENYLREIGNAQQLAAYWPLNEGPQAMRILDYSDNSFHLPQLIETNVLHADHPGGHYSSPADQAFNLIFQEGTNDLGQASPNRTKGHLTIELWFRLDTELATDGDRFPLLRNDEHWALEIVRTGAQHRIAFSYRDNGAADWQEVIQDPTVANAFINTGWTHLSLVYFAADPNKTDSDNNPIPSRVDGLFLDGQFQLLDTTAPNDVSAPANLTTGRLTLGRTASSVAAALPIYLTEVRFWGTLLHPYASSRNRFYQLRGTQLTDDNLLAYWALNEHQEAAAPEASTLLLAWSGQDPTTNAQFVDRDFFINPADQSPHRWNTRSELRLLPFSLVPGKNNAPLKIGALEPKNSLMRLGLIKNTHFAGMIDSVRVWNLTRRPEEIKAVWNQKINGTETGLIRYYRFDQGKGEHIRNFATRDMTLETDLKAGKFGGENAIRNLRLWKKALSHTELFTNMGLDDNQDSFPFDATDRYILHTPKDLLDEEGNVLTNPGGTTQTIEAPGQDEVLLFRGGIDTTEINLNGEFSIELEVKIDTFTLSGKEHYLLFKQEAWALVLYQEDNELYLAFTYDYQQNLQRKAWKWIAAHNTPLSRREWVYLAIVGTEEELKLYLDEDRGGVQLLSTTPYVQSRFAIKTNTFPVAIGQEGKPKWAVSDLLLMDGLQFDGTNSQLKLPRMVNDFSLGFCAEAWLFIDPSDDSTSDDSLPIFDLANEDRKDNIILSAVRSAAVGSTDNNRPYSLTLTIFQEDTPQSVSTSARLLVGEWIHVAATIDRENKVLLYQNGTLIPEEELVTQGTITLPRNTAREEGHNFIGRSNPGSLEDGTTNIHFFRGKLDEIRIWKRARSLRQLRGYMRRELPEVHEQLIAMWRFGEGSGVAAFDSTASGYHALLGDGNNDLEDGIGPPEWVILSERINAGLQFQKKGFVRISPTLSRPDGLLDFPEVNAFTLELWIKPLQAGVVDTDDIILLRNADGSQQIRLTYGDDSETLRLVLTRDGAEVTMDLPAVMFPGRWTHYAASITTQANESRIVLLAHREDPEIPDRPELKDPLVSLTKTFELRVLPATDTFREILLGQAFSGTLDEIRLWKSARSAGQVSANLFCKVDPFDRTTPALFYQQTEWQGATASLLDDLSLKEALGARAEQDREDAENGTVEDSPSKISARQLALLDQWSAVKSVRIPAGRNLTIIARRKNDNDQLPARVIAVFEDSTEDIYASQLFVEYHGPDQQAAVPVSDATVASDYVIEQLTLGYLTDGALLGYWPLDENTGTIIYDKTARRNEGVFEADPTDNDAELPLWIETSDIQYGGYRFDGYSEFLEIPTHPAIDPVTDFSITAWIEPNRFDGLQGIMTKVTNIDNSQFALSMEGEMLRFDYEKDGNNFSLVGGKIKDGWNHVAVTVKTRLLTINDLASDLSLLNRKAEAFAEEDAPNSERGILLQQRQHVTTADNPLRDILSIKVPVSKEVIISWELKAGATVSPGLRSARLLAKAYQQGTHNIYNAFSTTAGTRRGEPTRQEVLDSYEIKEIRSNFSAQQRMVRLPKIHLYVNGRLVHSGIAPEETARTGFKINVGAWGGKVRKHFFHGTIDHLALWGKGLSQKDIQQLIDNSDLNGSTGLAGYWRPDPVSIQEGVVNRANNSYGLGRFGLYDRGGDMLRYEPRLARKFSTDSQLTIPPESGGLRRKLVLEDAAFTIEYWFKGTAMNRVFSQEDGDHFIRSGSTRDNPAADATLTKVPQLPEHLFSHDTPVLKPVEIDPSWDVFSEKWHHIAVVWEQNQIDGYRSYLDGQLIARGDTGNQPVPRMRTLPVIGSNIDGQLAEVRVWSTARLQNDIRRDKNRVLNGKEAGLVAYWPFDDDGETLVRDATERSQDLNAVVRAAIALEGQAENTEVVENSGLFLLNKLGKITLNALEFNGEDSYAHIEAVPGISFNNNFTIEASIQLPCEGPILSRMLLDDTERGNERPAWRSLFVRDNQLIFGFRPARGRYFEYGKIDLPSRPGWYNIAISVNVNRLEMQFYIDGLPVEMVNFRTVFLREDARKAGALAPINSISIGIGRTSSSFSAPLAYFQGKIGEVRLWNHIRSEANIRSNHRRALMSDAIGLEGLWRFTTGEGNLIESLVPEESSAARINNPTWALDTGFVLFGAEEDETSQAVTEVPPNCLHLNGSNQHLNLGTPAHLTLLDHLTLEAWIFLDTIAGEQTIITKGEDGELDLRMVGNKLNYLHGGNFRQEFDFEFIAGQWYHVAVTRNNTVKFIRAYVNGQSLNGTVYDGIDVSSSAIPRTEDGKLYAQAPVRATNNALLVGNNHAKDKGLQGRIMEVRVWNLIRRESMLRLFRGRRLRGNEEGLLAYLPLATNSNDLDAGDTKRIDITVRVPHHFDSAQLEQSSPNLAEITALKVDQNGTETLEDLISLFELRGHSNLPGHQQKLVGYTLSVEAGSDNFKRLTWTENLMGRFNNDATVHAISSDDFVLNPRFGTNSAETLLLGLPDHSSHANHAVLHGGGRIRRISTATNELARNQYGAIRIDVKVFSTLSLDTFKNTLMAHARKASNEAISVSLSEQQLMVISEDELLQLGSSPLLPTPAEEATPNNEVEEATNFRAFYTIIIKNLTPASEDTDSTRLQHLQIQENLEAIFQAEDVKALVNKWEIIGIENHANPALLLPPELNDLLVGEDQAPLVFNPLYDGENRTNLLGLGLEDAPKIAIPPINLAKAAHTRKLLEAQNRRRKRPGMQKSAGAHANNPLVIVDINDLPPTRPTAPEPASLTAFATPPAPALRASSPISISKIGDEVKFGENFVLPDQVAQLLVWAAEPNTEAEDAPLQITFTGDDQGLEEQRNDNEVIIGIRAVGAVKVSVKDFTIDVTLLKNNENSTSSWDYTFLLKSSSVFDFQEIALSNDIPLISALSLNPNGLSNNEQQYLDALQSDDVTVNGSIAAVEDYLVFVASELRPLLTATEEAELLSDVAGNSDLDLATLVDRLAAETGAMADPYPGLHTHQNQPLPTALTLAQTIKKRTDSGQVSNNIKRNAYLPLLAALLAERDNRRATFLELNTRATLPLGFVFSNIGIENTKINRGFSVSGKVGGGATASLGLPGSVDSRFFVNYDFFGDGAAAASGSYLAEATIRIDLTESSNPAFVLANSVFGLDNLNVYVYKLKETGSEPQDALGMKAETRISLRPGDSSRPLSTPLFLVNAIFGVEEILLAVEGNKNAGEEAELSIEGRATIKLDQPTGNPLLRVAYQLLGLNTVELVMAADNSGGVSMIATGHINLRDAETDLTQFVLDLFGLQEVVMTVTAEIVKVGSQTSLGVSADIAIELGESKSPFFKFINELFGVESIGVLIEIDESEFSLHIDLGVDKEITDLHRLVEVYIATVVEYRPPTMELNLGLTFRLDTGDGIINLIGQLGVQVSSAGPAVEGAIGMVGDWRNPFGVEGLTLSLLIVQLGLTPKAPFISKLALAAKLRIGRTDLEIAAKVDLNDPSKNGFVGDVRNLNMMDVVGTLTGPNNTVPRSLTPVLSGMQLDHFRMSVIPNPPLEIEINGAGVSYNDEGVTAICDLNLWGFEAFAFLQVNYTDGLMAFASFSAMELIPGVLKIERGPDLGMDSPPVSDRFERKGGPEMYVKLNAHETPEIYISGKVTILNMISRSLAIYLREDKLKFITEANFLDLFIINIEVEAATDFSSLFFKAEMTNDFFAKAREVAVKAIQDLRDAAMGELNAAQAEVDGIWDDIEARRRVVKAAFEAAQGELRSARNKVVSARNAVNDIRSDIKALDRKFKKLSWWKKAARAIPYGIEKGVLEAAVAIADGILYIAEEFLHGLELALDVIPVDLDPVIIALKAAHALATAGLEIAKLAVEGFAYIATAVVNLALGEFFDIRYAMFQGTFSTGIGGKMEVLMKANLIFLGQPIDIDFMIDLKAIESGVKGLVDKLLEA